MLGDYILNTILGFCTISSAVKNMFQTTGLVGELTPTARTYSDDIQQVYGNGHVLDIFSAKDTAGGRINVDSLTANGENVLLMVVELLVANGTLLNPSNKTPLINKVLLSMGGKVKWFDYTDHVTDGSLTVPALFEVKFMVGTIETYAKIWLKESVFRIQYPEYKIIVIPPLANIDDLLLTDTQLMSRFVAEDGLRALPTKVFSAQQNYPATAAIEYTSTRSTGFTVPWHVLCYGAEGQHPDLIKAAIEEYVVANSTLPIAAWKEVYPDIWYRPEALVMPFWDSVAIPNLSTETAIQSSVFDIGQITTVNDLDPMASSDRFLGSKTAFTTYPMNNLGICIKLTNDYGTQGKSFKDLYPDYLPVPSSHVLFNRQGSKTRAWSIFMEDLLIVAKDPTYYTQKARRIVRNGRTYAAGSFGQILWLVTLP